MSEPLAVECSGPRAAGVPATRTIAQWARAALGTRGQGHEMALRLVSRNQMRELNHRYRGKDRPTNVLSFPVAVPAGVRPAPLGDVVICPSVLREEAREQGKQVQAHWAHLVVHGALHLAGYDHEQDADARRMERREIAVLRSLGFPNPYIARSAPTASRRTARDV